MKAIHNNVYAKKCPWGLDFQTETDFQTEMDAHTRLKWECMNVHSP